jgi:hypothetical protein
MERPMVSDAPATIDASLFRERHETLPLARILALFIAA